MQFFMHILDYVLKQHFTSGLILKKNELLDT